MPVPIVDPSPPARELRLVVPLLAQDASYFAASTRIARFCWSSIRGAGGGGARSGRKTPHAFAYPCNPNGGRVPTTSSHVPQTDYFFAGFAMSDSFQ